MNQYLIGDNITHLKNMDVSCDLIYIDPPYNTGRNFGDYEDKWTTMKDYAEGFLYPRLELCYEILKSTGSIVVHVEPRNSHHVRFGLDKIFGHTKFRNEISWKSGGHSKNLNQLGRMHDTIIVYSKSSNYTFNPIYFPYDEEYLKNTREDDRGKYSTSAIHNSQPEVNPRPNLRYEWNGHNRQWYTTKEKMQVLHDENRLLYNVKGIPRIKRYVHEMDGIPITDLWTDISNTQAGEKVDYATQKPVSLLKRIINLYSNEGDLVVDMFGGSGTTGIAAIQTNRKYLLIDINPKGKRIFEERCEKIPLPAGTLASCFTL